MPRLLVLSLAVANKELQLACRKTMAGPVNRYDMRTGSYQDSYEHYIAEMFWHNSEGDTIDEFDNDLLDASTQAPLLVMNDYLREVHHVALSN